MEEHATFWTIVGLAVFSLPFLCFLLDHFTGPGSSCRWGKNQWQRDKEKESKVYWELVNRNQPERSA